MFLCDVLGTERFDAVQLTHYELWVHLGRHEDDALLLLQLWVVVEDQLTGGVLTHRLDDNNNKSKKLSDCYILYTYLVFFLKNTNNLTV